MNKKILSMALMMAIANVYADKSTTYTYNKTGQLTTIEGPRTDVNDITTYTYTTNGQVQSITNALGDKVTYSNFDKQGNPLTITDENGIITTLAYTTEGWLASTSTAGLKTIYSYDEIGQIIKVTLPDSSTLTYKWDEVKRLTSITNDLNDSINYRYDAMGNRTEETTKKGSTITKQLKRQFDELGRVIAVIGANNQRYVYNYGNHDKPTIEKAPNGLQITNTYDGLDRLYITRENQKSNWTQYYYDLNDDITYARDRKGGTTNYTYNNTHDLTQESGNARSYINYQYDEGGNVTQETNAKGNTINYSYDALNRLISQVYPKQTELNITYQYDQPSSGYYNKGKLTTIQNNSGITQYNYNNQGLIAQQKIQLMLDGKALDKQQTINYTYDNMGRAISTKFDTVTVNYTRGKAGQITSVSFTKAGKATTLAQNINYLPFQTGITSLTFGNGMVMSRTYDLDNQLTQQKTSTITINYRYDNNGNIIQIADSQWGTTNYEYDAFNQLTKEQSKTTTTYTYDMVGNRLTKVANNQQQTIDYDSGNYIRSISGTHYQKDSINNITGFKDSTIRYEYDQSNRLSKVIKTENKIQTTLAQYIHNAYGERTIKVKDDGSISTYLYNDIGQLTTETQYNASQQKLKEIYWVWLDTMPIAQIEIPFNNNVASPETITYIHSDHLNTPRWATNAAKQIVWTWQSDAYGTTMANEDPRSTGVKTTLPLRFPGQYYDQETSFHYNYFRTYIPELGRYSQSDPIGLEGGWNTFAYVRGNPLKLIDAKGLQTTIQCLPGVCIISNNRDPYDSYGSSNILGGLPPTTASGVNTSIPSVIGSTSITGMIVNMIVNNSSSSSCNSASDVNEGSDSSNNGCPPCKTVSGKVVAVGTVGYRPLDIISETEKQHGVYGSHHNIFIANQAPKNSPNPCRCFWQKQNYVLKPAQLTSNMMPVEEFIY